MRNTIMHNVWRRECNHLAHIPQQPLRQVGPPNVGDTAMHCDREQQSPESFIKMHSCLRVVGQENIGGRCEHFWQFWRQTLKVARQFAGQSEDRIHVRILVSEELLHRRWLVHMLCNQRPIVGSMTLYMIQREPSRPNVSTCRLEGWVWVEDAGSVKRVHLRPRHVDLPSPWQVLAIHHTNDGYVCRLEAVVVIRIVDDPCSMCYGVQIPKVLAAEVFPRNKVNNLKVERALLLHREIDDPLDVIILGRPILVCHNNKAPALLRHLPKHAGGRRRLENGRHNDPALAPSCIPHRLQVAAFRAGKLQLILGNFANDVARKASARHT
mmetsp:Transcript_29991/g.69754  ORF Transcript_29991/g.69754 Transcript_29991/m.69754 type:complete len:325 (-) Transcript_29991:164-1138(-)